jgi:hypothetical protein
VVLVEHDPVVIQGRHLDLDPAAGRAAARARAGPPACRSKKETGRLLDARTRAPDAALDARPLCRAQRRCAAWASRSTARARTT